MIQRIVVDAIGQIFTVTNMYDRQANETNDPQLAISMVVKLSEDAWRGLHCSEADIYTMH